MTYGRSSSTRFARLNVAASLVTMSSLFLVTTMNVTMAQNNASTTLSPTASDLFSVNDLPQCTLSTGELIHVDQEIIVEPCILFDIQPPSKVGNSSSTTLITVVGVFDALSGDHRDGAVVAVEALNADNEGQGAAIGYHRDHYVQFRFVAAIPGNSRSLSPRDYELAHQKMLESLLVDLSPHYILGTATFHASLEKELAGLYETILFSQVGPQSFYEGPTANDHIFGIHIASEGYGMPAFQAVRFGTDSVASQKIRIVYRDRSEFFFSTCRHVYDRALLEGFENTVAIEYNPEADHDVDGILNQDDIDFVQGLADQACGPDEANDGIAIWACIFTTTEANVFLQRLGENGCRPSSLWLTVSSWAWANDFPDLVPYTQSAAQWHSGMAYSDEFFADGNEMLKAVQRRFDLPILPSSVALGSYHGIYLMYHNLRSFFKGKDIPQVDLALTTQYEEIRRNILDLAVPISLYGPTSFDESRRNIGRGCAGLQWQTRSNDTTDGIFELLLVSPLDQAVASVVFPAPVAEPCLSGQFTNRTRLAVDPDLLSSKCDKCPVNTFKVDASMDVTCQVCFEGSTTDGRTGAAMCMEYEENLVSRGLKASGLGLMSIVWLVAVYCMCWTYYHRQNPVVQLSQPIFLVLLCVGSIISSSSIIPLSLHAGSFDDEAPADRACMALPWLYTTGWMLQYSCISVKSYRMYSLVKARERMRRVEIKIYPMLAYVGLLLCLDFCVVIPWTIIDPFVWRRAEVGTTIDQENGVQTVESVGRCGSDHLGWWVGPIAGVHFLVMICTNLILFELRHVSDRYQESRYFVLASIYIFEILILGIPIVVAVADAVQAAYVVLVCIVGLSDLGILLMIFVPKMFFARQGLPEGVSVGESLFTAQRRRTNAVDAIRKKAEESANRHMKDLSRTSGGVSQDPLENSKRSEVTNGPTPNLADASVAAPPHRESEIDAIPTSSQELWLR